MIVAADYVGKKNVVLIFYPADDTPGCIKQLCAARDALKDYEERDTAIIGVNPASRQNHEAFAQKYNLSFPIIEDTGGGIRKAYDVNRILGLVAQQRIVYIIDKSWKIAFAGKGNRSTQELLDALDRLR